MHHIYPRNHLKKQGLTRGRYNQIANFVVAQSEINIAIGDKPPEKYFSELAEQCNGGKKIPTYEDFLGERRQLMALKIKTWFDSL